MASVAAEPPSHASVPPTRDARFMHVLKMFAGGSWRKGLSDLELAAAWGCNDSTVRHLSAEAGRWLRLSPRFKRQIRTDRAALCMRLYDAADRARARDDFKAEIAALDKYGEYAGLKPTQRTELTGKDGGPIAVQAVPLEDLDALRAAANANTGSTEPCINADNPHPKTATRGPGSSPAA